MKVDYAAISHRSLAAGTGYLSPSHLPPPVALGDPATTVMTDFARVTPRTTRAEVPIDTALDEMRDAGVRLLLVRSDLNEVIGLVSSYDIQGERPLQLVNELRVPRDAITVGQIMAPAQTIQVLDLPDVEAACVGHVVATLRALETRHVLVCDPHDGGRVRGLFSAAEVGRRLGVDIDELMVPAHSLAEIVQEIA